MNEEMKNKDEKYWQEKLSQDKYKVLREKGTEAPGSGELLHEKREGSFKCGACGAKLFESGAKFDSGTGWPSFGEALPQAVELKEDDSGSMKRTEVICGQCGSHLGHIFLDGPDKMPDGRPGTGKRYCINSLALDFKAEEKNNNKDYE